MGMSKHKKTLAQPSEPWGTVSIAGEMVNVGSDAIGSTPGSSQERIIKGLKKASDEGIFSPSIPIDSSE